MGHVDFFSRNSIPVKSQEEFNKVTEKRIKIAEISEDWLLVEQWRDSEISEITTTLENGDLAENLAKTFEFRAGVLYRKIQRLLPWHIVYVDITGKLSDKNNSKEYVTVKIDTFTKFVLLHLTRKIDTVNIIKPLNSAVSLFGTSTRVVADQGKCFTGKEFQDFFPNLKILNYT